MILAMRKLMTIMSRLAGLGAVLLTGPGAMAQTCTGGLGDPIVNITFGQGVGNGPALAAGITNLIYQSTDCPSDGYYTIASKTVNCFDNTWFSVTKDHTGNANGYFMLVNASFQPNDFYVQTVNGLCGNTSYQFGAWVLNMVSKPYEILPNITFSIEKTDGTVLQQFSTGDIPETDIATWVQYAFYFNTPPGISSVVLRMTNNQIGGDGNDIALDDITFRPAGSSIKNAVAGFASDSVSFCVDAQPVLTVNATVESCYPSESVQWQQSMDGGKTWSDIPGATTASWTRASTAAGLWLYRLLAAQTGNLGISTCEVASTPVSVSVIPIPDPQISITGPVSVCAGAPASFTATPVEGGAMPAYQWMINGSAAGEGLNTFTTSALNDGDLVNCALTSNALCVEGPPVASNSLSVPVTAIPATGVSIAASAVQICQDSTVLFTAAPVNGGSTPSYQWQVNGTNAGSNAAVFSDAGLQNGDVVNCLMTASLTCSEPVSAVSPVTMTVNPLPTIKLDTAIVIAGGSSVRLQPVITGDIASLSWTPAAWLDNAGVADPLASPPGNTTYRLTAVTTDGCTASASETVDVFYDVKMPGAFTPNGDGVNDLFRVPPSVPVTIRQLAVYNRTGLLVFYTTNGGSGWDGNYNGHPQPSGVYVWYVEYNDPLTKNVEMKKGAVVLVR
jgi:gliding motility-associated-like protein